MRKTFALAAAAATLAILPAMAQTNPYAKRGYQPYESYGSYRPQPSPSPRMTAPYNVPDGFGGTIRWNTPNKDGNFGGPGGGGSAGSGG